MAGDAALSRSIEGGDRSWVGLRPTQTCAEAGWAFEPPPSTPLFLVDEELRVLWCSRSAQHILGDETHSFARLLDHPGGARAQELRQMVREAIAAGGCRTRLLNPGAADVLLCCIRPLPAIEPACAVLVLTPLRAGSPAVQPCLRTLYKLSKAEAEVAAAAANGADVLQIAEARQVSIRTLRAQIASIKAKMGVTRTTEIAVAVSRIEAALTWL